LIENAKNKLPIYWLFIELINMLNQFFITQGIEFSDSLFLSYFPSGK